MEIKDVIQAMFQYGGTVIMAVLFVWVFFQDRTRNNALLEEIRELVKTIKISNENISQTLDLLQSGCEKLDDKVDRNYEAIIYRLDNKKEETK